MNEAEDLLKPLDKKQEQDDYRALPQVLSFENVPIKYDDALNEDDQIVQPNNLDIDIELAPISLRNNNRQLAIGLKSGSLAKSNTLDVIP